MRLSKTGLLIAMLLALTVLGLFLFAPSEAGAANRASVTDPHEGQVYVSFHQHEIAWKKVKSAGYEVAIIQVGRRGYTKGGLSEDERFAENIRGAIDAGMRVGVYFFSQAISVEEAIEEAEMTLRLIEPYRDGISMPVYYD